MYYAKFTNGQVIAQTQATSTTSQNWYIRISNGIIIITNNTTFDVIANGILKDDDIYLPLEDDNDNYFYVKFNSTNYNSYYFYSVSNVRTTTIYDEDFNEVGTRYFYIVGYNTAGLIVLKNPLTMASSNNTTYTSSDPVTISSPTCYTMGKTGDFNQNITLSTLIKSLVSGGTYKLPFNNQVEVTISMTNIIGTIVDYKYDTTYYDYLYSYQNFILMCSTYNMLGQLSYIPVNPVGIYKQINLNETISFNSGYLNTRLYVTNDFEDENIIVYQARENVLIIQSKTTNEYFNKDMIYTLYRYSASTRSDSNNVPTGFYKYNTSYNYFTLYQDKYVPTNKLKTPTFSSLEVQHNEESGTYAVTFTANNPNSVSVNVDIKISGREGTDTITLPSGTSEWSFAIAENKQGTLQGTNINALGYDNADDTPKYTYYEWVAPGYLRELVMPLAYLSTTDDKNYTLNVSVENPNAVVIPCVVHYGKNGEYTASQNLKPGLNFLAYKNIENSNGIVWLHPEPVSGYYPLPDTDSTTYTKLPIPPTPSSTGITLYKNNNNNKVVNKGYKLETYKVLNGTFRDSVNILNPVFQINNDEVPDCNYCYIADFRRYYYIDTITCVRTGLYEIECSVDVLYTYKDDILKSEQYISRQENEYNELLIDNMVTFDEDYEYNIEYANIDELDYGNKDSEATALTDKTNIILCTYGSWGG